MKGIFKGTKFINYTFFPRFLYNYNISETARMVYVLLLDRAKLSLSNYTHWSDEAGEVYSNFTIENLAKALDKSESTIKSCLKTLREAGLIRTEQRGACRPNRIYVYLPDEYIESFPQKSYDDLAEFEEENIPVIHSSSLEDEDLPF